MEKNNDPKETDLGRDSSPADYPHDHYTPEGKDPQNAISHTNMMLRETRWARTDSGWRSVVAVALIVFLCIGVFMLLLVMQRGWDGLLAMLGY